MHATHPDRTADRVSRHAVSCAELPIDDL